MAAAREQPGTARVEIRPLREGDAAVLLDLYLRNARFLRPWEPLHDGSWLTPGGQELALAATLRAQQQGLLRDFMILDGGQPAGRVTLSEITRGAFQNTYLGYFVSQDHNGHGVATAAARLALDQAFRMERLHRVQAAIMPRNAASIRVAEKAGLRREGVAVRYLRIDGRWEDHLIYAVTAEEWTSQTSQTSG
jgi:[ribosomal protein S5]-alanine N-acetyltransferase